MTTPKLLIVDDDEAIRTQLKYALRADYTLAFAENRAQALTLFQESRPALVSLDLGLPPAQDAAEEGLRTLEEILRLAPATKVVVVTGNGDRQNALRAVELGAFDYHAKPIDLDEYKVVLKRAAYLHGLEAETQTVQKDREEHVSFEDMLGSTPRMREIFAIIQRVAKSDATVLVEGESGTGKELIARAIHARSGRRGGPFVPINCGAIPEMLLESELFGHEKGAFTGAHVQRRGKFELADRGTLFLDEIGELPLLLQVKLLRFLQERTVERVGGRHPIPLDLRIIAATNRDLPSQLQKGLFREDLYYRLSVVTIQVPPLRDRGEDVILLANTFLQRAAPQKRVRFSPDALRALTAHLWPGNIRELENRVSRAVIMAHERTISPADLDLTVADAPPTPSLRETRERVERATLVEVLTQSRGNVSRAARELKVSRPTLHDLLDKHQLNAKDFR